MSSRPYVIRGLFIIDNSTLSLRNGSDSKLSTLAKQYKRSLDKKLPYFNVNSTLKVEGRVTGDE